MKHVLISGLTLNDAVLLSSPSSSSLVPSCGSHCDNDRVVAETDGGSALIVPSDCLPTAPPRAVTLLDVCLELVCIVSCLFNPLHCHFRLRLWGPVAQLHAPPPPSPCSCAVYTTPRRRHPRVGVCGCFPLTVCGLLCFISFMYLYTLYTVPMFRIKAVERADQIGVGFLRRTKSTNEYLKHSAERVTDTKRSLITWLIFYDWFFIMKIHSHAKLWLFVVHRAASVGLGVKCEFLCKDFYSVLDWGHQCSAGSGKCSFKRWRPFHLTTRPFWDGDAKFWEHDGM